MSCAMDSEKTHSVLEMRVKEAGLGGRRRGSTKVQRHAEKNLRNLLRQSALHNVLLLAETPSPFRDPLLPVILLVIICLLITACTTFILVYHNFWQVTTSGGANNLIGFFDILVLCFFLSFIFLKYVWKPFVKQFVNDF